MIRKYTITWYPIKSIKYGKEPIYRTNTITLSNPTGKTNIDAKNALNLFLSNFGNLKRNVVVCIKEFDENGQIGEDILPTEEDSIIPIGR